MDQARQIAENLVAAMTLDEKISLLSTTQHAIPRLNIPEFHIGGEAAHGIVDRGKYQSTSFPIPLTLAQTWNPELARQAGHVVGVEARALYNTVDPTGRLMPWAPTIDMLRDPRWGRNEEAYGEDPWLAGSVAGGYIDGMQGKGKYKLVAAAPKHFLGNNTESHRSSESNTLSPRMLHEYYLKPFYFAFRDHHAQSMMTAYNGVNGVPMMQSPELHRVKEDWGMDGCVVTDGGALTLNIEDYHYFDHDADAVAAALNAGIDCLVDDANKVEQAVRDALSQGLLTETTIDQAVTNTLTVRGRLGQFADVAPFSELNEKSIGTEAGDDVVRQVIASGSVLLKNDGVLPLNKSERILVTGPSADRFVRDWYATKPMNRQTLQAGLMETPNTRVDAVDSNDQVKIAFTDQDAVALASYTYSAERFQDGRVLLREDSSRRYLRLNEDKQLELHHQEVYDWVVREAFILDADGQLYAVDHNFSANDQNAMQAGGRGRLIGQVTVIKSGLHRVKAALAGHDKVVVAIGNHPLLIARETEDRTDLELPEAQKALVNAIHATGAKTVTVLLSGYPFAVDTLQTDALLTVGYAGQSMGRALADVLYGVTPPTGKLAQTWYSHDWVAPSMRDYDIESTKRTYQYADPKTITYPFGYGLTYGTLTIDSATLTSDGEHSKITLTITNSNAKPVSETVQVYLRATNLTEYSDRRQLVAFKAITLAANTTKSIQLTTMLADFSWFDPVSEQHYFPSGQYYLQVGFNSRDVDADLPVNTLVTREPSKTDLSQPLDARAYAHAENVELVVHDNYYAVPALNPDSSICYRHLSLDEEIYVALYATTAGKLKTASGAEAVFGSSETMQLVKLPVIPGDNQSLTVTTTAPVILVQLRKKIN